MNKKDKYINADRRRFMQSSAIIGGATAASSATEVMAADVLSADIPETQKAGHAGYRLTERVKEYYRKARF